MTTRRIRNRAFLSLSLSLCLSLALVLVAGSAQAWQAVVDGNTVTFDLGHTLDTRRTLQTDYFEAVPGTAGAAALSVARVAFTAGGAGLELTLSRALAAGEAITVKYRWPRSGEGLWTASGGQIDNFALPVQAPGAGEAPVALTAEFHDLPATHNGAKRFEFEIRFGEEIAGLRLSEVKAALSATGGRIVAVKRAVAGEIRRVTVQVRPDAAAGVTVTLAATTDCTAAAAICAGDGRMLAAAVTATVPYGVPLTAALHGVPASHDGDQPFSVEVRFSQEFAGLDLAAFAAGALQVTNGRVVEAAQTVTGHNRSVTLRVFPTSWRDVTLTLSATTADCTAAAAVCTPDGRALSNTDSATVTGPQSLSAELHGVPAMHYGSGLLDFEVRFNQEFRGLRLPAFRNGALQVTGGRLVDVWRATPGQNRSILVRLRPTSHDDVVITLAATTADCSAAAAICTVDGRRLSNTSSATVTGLAPLTADFHGVPARHDGSAPFSFEVRFNQEFQGLDVGAFAAGALLIGNGRLVEAAQTVAGQNRSVTLRVIPQSWRDVTLSLPASADCAAAAICTSDGRRLSNTVTATVEGPPPLTAAFHGVPAEHDGSHRFGFEVRFNQEFRGLRLPAFKNGALQVTGGRLIDAKRAAAGENRSINVRARPSGFDDMVITLPATTDCTAAGAICAVDGRMLSNTVTATVRGPVTISVADAEAEEAAGATIDFAVTLNRAAAGTVTVDYATADGTATAGEDYTAASGTLTFAAGVLTQTVAVTLLDDAIDEGRETFTLTLSNPSGAVIADGEAVGTIINTDLMPKAWNARFGRTVAVHVVDAVEARLQGDGAGDSFVQVGGHRLGGAPPDVLESVQSLAPELDLFAQDEAGEAQGDSAVDPAGQTLTFRDLLLGSAFHLVSDPGDEPDAPRLSAWGRVAASGFDAVEDKLSLNGTVTTASLGVDGAWKRWLTGLLLAYSEGDGAFSHADLPGGDVASSLTSLHPYAAYRLSDRVRLWGTVGYGSGALRLTLDNGPAAGGEPVDDEAARRVLATDLAMTMGALGARGELLQPARGVQLALRSDVLWMVMDSAAAHNLGATSAEVSRLRLVLEGSRPVSLKGGGSFRPTLQIGLRHDGGDAETGTGVEVGAGLRYASAWGLSVEASVRTLVAHEAEDYREWGASGALRYDPGRQGLGLTASIMPTWGTAASGVERLWGQPGGAALGVPGGGMAPATGRLDAELGYGVAALRGRGLLTPYARVALTEGADQAWHLGARLGLAESLKLSLEASRRSRAGAASAHDLALLATLGF